MAQVGGSELAKVLNVTQREVQQLVREGMPRRDDGTYELGECMLWRIRSLRAKVAESTPALVGVEQVAKTFGISKRFVQELVEQGLPKARHGRYNLLACTSWYIGRLRRNAEVQQRELARLQAAHSKNGRSGPLEMERIRLTRAQADAAELQLREKRSELIPADVVEHRWAELILIVRERVLARSAVLAPQLTGESAGEFKRRLNEYDQQTLTLLSQYLKKHAIGEEDEQESQEGDRPPKAAPAALQQPDGAGGAP